MADERFRARVKIPQNGAEAHDDRDWRFSTMHADRVRKLRRSRLSKSEIAHRLQIGPTYGGRILAALSKQR
jgi:hypothetical protein